MNLKELDPKFRQEIMSHAMGERLNQCYQCTKCTAGCPIAEIDENYNPRRLMRMAILGMREEVLKSPELWMCLQCYTCQERCPQDVKISEVITVLKNIAFEAGHAPTGIVMGAKLIADKGRLYEIDEFHNDYRYDLGLPAIEEDAGDVGEILRLSGLMDKIEKGGE